MLISPEMFDEFVQIGQLFRTQHTVRSITEPALCGNVPNRSSNFLEIPHEPILLIPFDRKQFATRCKH
jgi:hypothetical protein